MAQRSLLPVPRQRSPLAALPALALSALARRVVAVVDQPGKSRERDPRRARIPARKRSSEPLDQRAPKLRSVQAGRHLWRGGGPSGPTVGPNRLSFVDYRDAASPIS